jgi:hypothetical protein
VLFALEIVVDDFQSGEILLNPGSYKLPRPYSANMKYTYYGYVIAGDIKDAQAIFKDKKQAMVEKAGGNQHQSPAIDMISTDYQMIGQNEDNVIKVDNIDGDWLNMCQVASKRVSKEDIIFKTMQDSKLAENHIIICGMVENIRYFVMPLRAKHLNDPSPIVILHEEQPTSKQWQQLSYFSQIYFVQGSSLNEESFDRVNIMKAKQVVILTPASDPSKQKSASDDANEDDKEEKSSNHHDENLRDAKTIFMYNIIKKKNPNVNVVTELISQDNIAFMLDDPLLYFLMNNFEYDQTPIFTSGEIYLSSLMDYNICQAFYNPSLTTVLRSLIIGETSNAKKKANSKLLDGDFSHVKTSNLYHIKVPEQFAGRKYYKLFDYLTNRRSMVPLALYRKQKVDLNAFTTENKNDRAQFKNKAKPSVPKFKEVCYVVTNPARKTPLNSDDLVFVLA